MTRILICDHNSLHFFICIYTWLTFTINYFLEHEWYLCPLTAVAYMSVTTFICDDYTTCLKIDKLHHPCSNDTRTMQKQGFFFWVTNFRQEWPSLLFLCVCTCHACYVVHTHCTHTNANWQFPQKQNDKSDWCWQRWLCNWVMQLVRLQSFQGMLVTGVRFRLSKFPPSNKQVSCSRTPHLYGIFPIDEVFWTSWKALDRWWEALASSQLTDKKYPRWSKWLRLWKN